MTNQDKEESDHTQIKQVINETDVSEVISGGELGQPHTSAEVIDEILETYNESMLNNENSRGLSPTTIKLVEDFVNLTASTLSISSTFLSSQAQVSKTKIRLTVNIVNNSNMILIPDKVSVVAGKSVEILNSPGPILKNERTSVTLEFSNGLSPFTIRFSAVTADDSVLDPKEFQDKESSYLYQRMETKDVIKVTTHFREKESGIAFDRMGVNDKILDLTDHKHSGTFYPFYGYFKGYKSSKAPSFGVYGTLIIPSKANQRTNENIKNIETDLVFTPFNKRAQDPERKEPSSVITLPDPRYGSGRMYSRVAVLDLWLATKALERDSNYSTRIAFTTVMTLITVGSILASATYSAYKALAPKDEAKRTTNIYIQIKNFFNVPIFISGIRNSLDTADTKLPIIKPGETVIIPQSTDNLGKDTQTAFIASLKYRSDEPDKSSYRFYIRNAGILQEKFLRVRKIASINQDEELNVANFSEEYDLDTDNIAQFARLPYKSLYYNKDNVRYLSIMTGNARSVDSNTILIVFM